MSQNHKNSAALPSLIGMELVDTVLGAVRKRVKSSVSSDGTKNEASRKRLAILGWMRQVNGTKRGPYPSQNKMLGNYFPI